MQVNKAYTAYTPVNNIYLLETETPKVKSQESYDTSSSGILLGRETVVETAKFLGKIVKKGPLCEDFEIGEVINFYPDTGIEHLFSDRTNKYLLIKSENFLGKIVEVNNA